MTRMKGFVKRFPLVAFFILAFVISWGCVLMIIGGPSGILVPYKEAQPLIPAAIVAMLIGPAAAGILLTVVVSGREGLREQLSGLRRWREGAGWYALALLTAPISATAILLALLPFSPEFLPAVSTAENKVSFVLIGIVAGLCVGLFEESGWTGFALPRLRRRFGVVGSGLILGFLWGAWHYILALWGSGTAEGILVLERFLPEMLFYVVVLPVYRVLMVWLYENTGSLLLTVLMHAGLTGTVPNILMPQEITGSGLMAWYLILAAVLWFVVFVAVKAGGGQLSCQPTGAQTD